MSERLVVFSVFSRVTDLSGQARIEEHRLWAGENERKPGAAWWDQFEAQHKKEGNRVSSATREEYDEYRFGRKP